MISRPERGNVKLRLLDRYIGIPVVIALGLIHRRKLFIAQKNIAAIAFMHTAAIGDTVILSASVKDIKNAYPHAALTLFTGSSNYEMAKLLTGIDRIIKLPVNNPIEAIKLIKKSGVFNLWIDFGPWPRLNAIFTYFAKASLKVGFKTKGQYRHYAYDLSVEHTDKNHELHNYRNLLSSLKIPCNNLPSISIESREQIKNNIAIHMYPGGYKSYLKEWPEERWCQLISRLAALGYEVYLTGGPGDRERAENVASQIGSNRVKVIAGLYSLKKTISFINEARLVISVNTGIMHIAAALGCNIIALHGPTSVARWGPISENALALHSSLACSPCLNLGFEYGCDKNACMQDISVAEVLNAVGKLISIE